MANQCPNCGISTENDEKFCPACGEPLPEADGALKDDEESSAPKAEPRVFFLRKKQYGDTEQFDDPGKPDEDPAQTGSSLKTDLGLYISIFAAVLAIAAIVLVVIFAVIPAQQESKEADAASSETSATAAPTQSPTDPPIAGEYGLSSVEGDSVGVLSYMYKDCVLKMSADYTGSLTFSSTTLSDVKLDKDSDKAEFMNTDCTYSFDGNRLTIDYRSLTLVFKKK